MSEGDLEGQRSAFRLADAIVAGTSAQDMAAQTHSTRHGR